MVELKNACSLARKNTSHAAREAEISRKCEESSSVLKKRGSRSRFQEGEHQHGEVSSPEGKSKTNQNRSG